MDYNRFDPFGVEGARISKENAHHGVLIHLIRRSHCRLRGFKAIPLERRMYSKGQLFIAETTRPIQSMGKIDGDQWWKPLEDDANKTRTRQESIKKIHYKRTKEKNQSTQPARG